VYGGCHRVRSDCAHAAQRHAHVVGFEDDADAPRRDILLEPVGDLLGEPLLDLKVSCDELDDPRKFGQAQDAFGGDVANVRDAMEWHEVVFAQRMERDVAGED
jgi:hypothetical protein